eukprot:CAMPEP_0202843882 /NCGR_PEP_ID=MMETSP1389-20130828/65754_1 /ASSEMBLY_ACC=CAM_ASM_000865 /TAXON_ID=302021 /ORGANISM="Rhodomonas sp., Strain CCMP768" /LENGTH=96 /DNA_ID=CAMNT_0049521083 /DNA_START=196 /DNA_END=486 /DNA_ORIENTATION=+
MVHILEGCRPLELSAADASGEAARSSELDRTRFRLDEPSSRLLDPAPASCPPACSPSRAPRRSGYVTSSSSMSVLARAKAARTSWLEPSTGSGDRV